MSHRIRAELTIAFLTAIAGAWFIHGSIELGIGSALRMEAGFFPVCLGGMMLVLSGAVALSALTSTKEIERPDLRGAGFVLAGLASFALALERAGLLVAVVLLVLLSMLALPGNRPTRMIALATGGALISWLIFGLAIGIQVPMIRSPF
ncbi:tripartite tricarboxylate transporter TctB family protein [Nitratireductor indicus]|uniref:tripartite tricarboxylate transporter TctB family protein n=1 Tax=Nitratireductor indicus TaxID=721133 RepID=UPI002875D9E5|nr:tripartite tricarboxylate transporter TctB family protein [Nitratireductor indicus]MDS1138771.1 tripartite tricarboxylate transporter TctB family protein [Nitratireductor indicus]